MDYFLQLGACLLIKLMLELLLGCSLIKKHMSTRRHRNSIHTICSHEVDWLPTLLSRSLSPTSSIPLSALSRDSLWAASSHSTCMISSLFRSISFILSCFSTSCSNVHFSISIFCFSSSTRLTSAESSAFWQANEDSHSATEPVHSWERLATNLECLCEPIIQPNFPWKQLVSDSRRRRKKRCTNNESMLSHHSKARDSL